MNYSSNNIRLATHISRVTKSILNDKPNVHSLMAWLGVQLGAIIVFVEPFQVAIQSILDMHNSAKIVGEVDNAMYSGSLYYCISMFCTNDLLRVQEHLVHFLHQMVSIVDIFSRSL